MKTFIVEPTNGTAPYEVQADSATYDSQSGAVLFKNGEGDDAELVGRVLNVSFREKPAAE